MTSHYTLYDVISHYDITWIALEYCSDDICVAAGCIPTLWFKIIKYSNKYVFISYILASNDIKPLNSMIYNKTSFVWCTVWKYHFVWGGGRSSSSCWLRCSSATPNSVILPHTHHETQVVLLYYRLM